MGVGARSNFTQITLNTDPLPKSARNLSVTAQVLPASNGRLFQEGLSEGGFWLGHKGFAARQKIDAAPKQ